MRRGSRTFTAMVRLAALAALCAATQPAIAQETEQVEEDRAAVQMLSEPPRHDFKASMEVSRPFLNFDQRLALVVRVELPGRELQAASVHRDLYMAVKAGDGTHWEPSGSYTHYEIKAELAKHDIIELVCTVYLRPGRWVLGVVLVDKVLKQRTVLLKTVDVSPLKNDPLPRLETGLPDVEFLKAEEQPLPVAPTPMLQAGPFPERGMGGRFGGQRGEGRRPGSAEPEGAATPAHRPESTPIEETAAPPVELNLKHPVALNVLVDFTPSEQYSGSNRMLRRTEATFWSVTHVLTRLRSPNLCVRVTGIDVIGQRTLFKQMDGSDMDWPFVAGELEKLDANTVQVQTLESRTKSAAFFRDAVDNLLSGKDATCASDAQRVYLIAASGILFPSGTASRPIEGNPVPLYYLRANLVWSDQWDAMAKIVKPLRPRVISINDPMKFRKALAEIVKDLEGTTDDSISR